MKKLLIIATAIMMSLPLQAMALGLYYDTCALTNDPVVCGTTDVFDEVTFYSETTVSQFGSIPPSIGDAFIDAGSLNATGFSFLAPGGSDVFLNSYWQLTGTLSGEGTVTDVNPTIDGVTRIDYAYTSGTLDLYAAATTNDSTVSTTLFDFGTRANTDDSGFDLGDKIGSFTLLYGIGHTFVDFDGGDVENQGSGEFLLSATELLAGFWFDANGNDLSEIEDITWFINFTDYNVDDPILVAPGSTFGEATAAFDLQVKHDGSMEFAVIPEPSTFLLLGGGLIGLGFLGYRRKRKNA